MSTKLFTTADVARARGCHPATVARIAADEGIGIKAGRDWVFSQTEVTALKKIIRDTAGQPRKTPRKPKEKRG